MAGTRQAAGQGILLGVLGLAVVLTTAALGAAPPEESEARRLNKAGMAHLAAGRYGAAEEAFRRSLQLYEAQLGPRHRDVAVTLGNLAVACKELHRYDEAAPLYRRSLRILEEGRGPHHPDVAWALYNLGEFYWEIGQAEQAEATLLRSLRIWEAGPGREANRAQALNVLGCVYQQQGRLTQAAEAFTKGLALLRGGFGSDLADVSVLLNNLAWLYQELEEYGRAEQYYRQALALMEKVDPEHPRVARLLSNLGWLAHARGAFDDAQASYRRALAMREARLAPSDPDIALSLNNLAGLAALRQEWGEAADLTDRACRLLNAHVTRTLPVLPEHEQLSFLQARLQPELHGAYSLGLARADDAGLVERSAAWVLNGKAQAQQALAEQTLLARDAGESAYRQLATELAQVRSQLGTLTLRGAADGTDRQERLRLAAREQQLSLALGRAVGRQPGGDPWVSPAQVREVLPADTVLVEIVGVRVWDFKVRGTDRSWRSAHYAAWVIPPAGTGEVRLVDLGEAGPIEVAVRAVREEIHAYGEQIAAPNARAEAEAEQRLRERLTQLARRVLWPLQPLIGSARHWILCPDGMLWLIPWEILTLPDGRYAVEEHAVSYVTTGRDLLRRRVAVPPGPPVHLADPDFDMGAREAEDMARRVMQDQPPRPLTRSGSSRPATLGRVSRLPFTALEAREVRPWLARYAGADPVLLLGKQALEPVVKYWVRNPKVFVLSTHAFFQEPRLRADEPLANPLLACGLILAGYNQLAQRAEPAGEDGVLTGLEIVGLDLRGTELVVLSACETSVGRVRPGEGVASLRQSFQLAGAPAIVGSLWSVPDEETARLMVRFFEGLANGKGRAEALREAQLSLARARRSQRGTAHPYYWAAFTLTGRWK